MNPKVMKFEYWGAHFFDEGEIIPQLTELKVEFGAEGYNIEIIRKEGGLGGWNFEIFVHLGEWLRDEFISELVKGLIKELIIRILNKFNQIDQKYDSTSGPFVIKYDDTTVYIYAKKNSIASFANAYQSVVKGILYLEELADRKPREIVLPVFDSATELPEQMQQEGMPKYIVQEFPFNFTFTEQSYMSKWLVEFHGDSEVYLFDPTNLTLSKV